MVKVTVYVDDEVWSKFRASVFHRHGSLKGISREVEGSLRSALVEEDLLPYLEENKTGLSPRTRNRPELKGPPAETHVRFCLLSQSGIQSVFSLQVSSSAYHTLTFKTAIKRLDHLRETS